MNGLKSIFGFENAKLPHSTVRVEDKAKSKQHLHSPSRNTLLYTFLFMVSNVVLRVNTASYLRKSRLHVFFLWLQSFMILLFLCISRKRRRWSFIQQVKHLIPLRVSWCYVFYIAINESYSNGYKNTSAGPEVLQLGLATSPLFIILTQTWFDKKADSNLVTIFVVVTSLISAVIFCSENDPYIPYKFTTSYGLFGLLHGLTMAVFTLISKRYLTVEEMYISELMYSINLACVLCLPFVMFLNGEIDIIITSGFSSHGGFTEVLFTAFLLALFRILDQIASFYHIKNLSSLLQVTTRSFAWIPATLIITFSFRMELLVSSFLGFWLVGAMFLAAFYW